MADFYTYLWLREDGTPYYVGKGHGLRAFRSKAHAVRRPKDSTRIVILPRSSEQEAFDTERELINNWGRLDLSTGCLRNRTDGGQGSSNVPVEVRLKRSIAAKTRWEDSEFRIKVMSAMKESHKNGFTPEHIAVMSLAHIGLVGKGKRAKGIPLSEQHKISLKNAWIARKKRLESGEEKHWTQGNNAAAGLIKMSESGKVRCAANRFGSAGR